MELLKALGAAALVLAFFYLMGAAIEWQADPGLWHEPLRAGLAMGSFPLAAVAGTWCHSPGIRPW